MLLLQERFYASILHWMCRLYNASCLIKALPVVFYRFQLLYHFQGYVWFYSTFVNVRTPSVHSIEYQIKDTHRLMCEFHSYSCEYHIHRYSLCLLKEKVIQSRLQWVCFYQLHCGQANILIRSNRFPRKYFKWLFYRIEIWCQRDIVNKFCLSLKCEFRWHERLLSCF